MTAPLPKRTIKSIQFLRFVAASLVVVSHLVLQLDANYSGAIPRKLMYLGGFGAVGVPIFFVISGFVMVYTCFSRNHEKSFSPWRFFARRLVRIYPNYWIIAALYLAFAAAFGTGPSLAPAELLYALGLFPKQASGIIGQAWTLSFELYFYLCFGAAMILGLYRGLIALTVVFAGLIAVSQTYGQIHPMTLQFAGSSVLVEFLFGAWIGYFTVRQIVPSALLSYFSLIAAACLFVAGAVYGYSSLPSTIAWGPPSALLVAGLVFVETRKETIAFFTRYSWLGDSSYSLYLLHAVIIEAAVMALNSVHPSLFARGEIALYFFGLLSLCIGAAAVFYSVVERRITGLWPRRAIVGVPTNAGI